MQRFLKISIKKEQFWYVLVAGGIVVLIAITALFSHKGANATEIIHFISPGDIHNQQTPPPSGLYQNPQNSMSAAGNRNPLGNNLGGRPQLIPELGAEVIGLSQGAVGVTGVMGNSLAEKAGLMKNDVIISFNKTDITSLKHFRRLIQRAPPEINSPMEIFRNGRIKSLSVMVGEGEMEGFTPIIPVTFTRPAPFIKF